MVDFKDDAGTIQTLLDRLEKFRLPRALAIMRRVEDGEKLSEDELEFLKRVLEEWRQIEPLLERHPEYQSLASRFVSLVGDITRKALENEQGT